MNDEAFKRWYDREVIQSPNRPGSLARREWLWRCATTRQGFSSRLHTVQAVAVDFGESFLSTIPNLVLDMTFGVAQVILSRKDVPNISNNENQVDFGKIVPLIMLLLPALAVMEIFFEADPGKTLTLFPVLMGCFNEDI